MIQQTNLDGLLVAIYALTDAINRNTAANEDAAKWRARCQRNTTRMRLVRTQTPSQEKERAKREIPPTPPIERKAEVMESIVIKEKEDTHLARARTRVGGESGVDTAVKRTRHSIPPTVDEVAAYCTQRKNSVDAQRFFDFYESKCWYIGKNKMRDWQAAVRTWERNNQQPENRVITIQKSNPTSLKVTDADRESMKEYFS